MYDILIEVTSYIVASCAATKKLNKLVFKNWLSQSMDFSTELCCNTIQWRCQTFCHARALGRQALQPRNTHTHVHLHMDINTAF